jgi:hypothetical protein
MDRIVLIVMGSVLAAMLLAAWRVTPDGRGFGTHQQLGLAPCTVVQWFGWRCPSCGMTTSWAHVVRGQIWSALKANAGGTLLAVAAMVATPWLMMSGAAGRWVVKRPHEWWLFGGAIVLMTVTLVQWAVRMTLGW